MIPDDAAAAGVTWQVHAGRRVTVHVPAGSRAARHAARELRDAERTIAVLEELLRPDEEQRGFQPNVFLVDPSPGQPAAVVGESGIIRVPTRLGGGEPVARPLTRLLVERWFGGTASDAIVDGTAGVAAARAGLGPSVDDADAWVRQELAAGRPVAAAGPPPGADGTGTHLSVTSFVAFLMADHGVEALRRFLAGYEPGRPDEAAIAAFGAPLAALTDTWLDRLRGAGTGRPGAALGSLVGLLTPHRWRYAEIVAYQAVAVVLSLVLPVVGGCVVGALRQEEGDAVCRAVAPTLSPGRLGLIAAGLAAVYLVDALLGLRRIRREDELFDEIVTSLRVRLFDRLMRQPARFYARHRHGDLAARLSTDTATVESSLSAIFGSGVMLGLTALAGAVTVVAKSPTVAALVLCVLPVFALIRRRLGARIAEAAFDARRLAGELVAAAQDGVAAQPAVGTHGLQARTAASYRTKLDAALRADDRLLMASATFAASVNLTLRAAQLATLGIGGYLVLEDRIGAGTVVTLLLLLPLVIDPVSALLDLPAGVATAAAALHRVTEIAEAPLDLAENPAAPDLGPLAAEARLDAVTFGYRPGDVVIDGVDLVIPAGAHVALVGPSGSGKSTVANLLVRSWDPDRGRVLFDGCDLRDVNLASVRRQVTVLSQEPIVLDATLRQNIAISRPDATDAEVQAATLTAGLTDLVERLPAGYDTVVGTGGMRLSGGQLRRVALARTILADPTLLVLDEATSGLDARTEAEITESLRAVMAGRTTVTITHRLALAAAADLIVVLDGGRVVEQGPHDQLVGAGGLYETLWRDQERFLAGGGPATVTLEATRFRTIPFFAGLSPEALARLVGLLGTRRFSAGEDLVRQGEPGDELFVLRRGEVDVLIDDGDGERRVNVMRPPQYFGELALVTGQPRSATVRAAVPTEVFTLDRQDFLDLLEREDSLRDQLAALARERRTAYDAAALAAGVAARTGRVTTRPGDGSSPPAE